ncbi:MAG TPA: arsenic resistance N-acetyltransferase ArsN2 [Vicinamibacteria bacterium]|jgi:amino-acid N-acetyltransferase
MISRAERAALPEVVALLQDSSLPVAGVAENFGSFLVARAKDGRLVGCIGLEVYGDVGLLRSLAVASSERGSGLGTKLVAELLDLARSKGVESLYLLTTTAESYFPRFGFERLSREEADPKLEASAELQGACPASAILMRRRL